MGLLSLLKACGVYHLKCTLLGVSPSFSCSSQRQSTCAFYKSLYLAHDMHGLVGCRLSGNIRLYFYSTPWPTLRQTNGCISTPRTSTTVLQARLTPTSA